MPARKPVGFLGIRQIDRVNTGNAIHGEAARRILGGGVELPRRAFTPEEIERYRDELSAVIFVAATTFHVGAPNPPNGAGLGVIRRQIEALGLPVVTIGLGHEARLRQTIAEAEVFGESVELLRTLGAHSESVGVRCAFTADLCRKMGVHNVDAIGCPSLHHHLSRTFPTPQVRPAAPERTAINVTARRNEGWMHRQSIARGYDIIGQTEPFLIQLAAAETCPPLDETLVEEMKCKPHMFKAMQTGELSLEELHAHARAHFHIFYDNDAWRAHMAERYDFSIGTRLHGNMAALQSGVPALWLVHDMRTKGLCDLMHLPSVTITEVSEDRPLHDWAEAVDFGPLTAHYGDLYDRFAAYLDRNGVTHNLTEGRAVTPAAV